MRKRRVLRGIASSVKWALLESLVGVGLSVLTICATVWLLDSRMRDGSHVVTTKVVTNLLSPEHLWNAELVETTDQSPFIVTTTTCDLYLIPKRNPADRIDILAVDTGGHDDEQPRMAWTSSNALKVTLYDTDSATILRRDVGHIHIDYAVDPAGPANRAAGLK